MVDPAEIFSRYGIGEPIEARPVVTFHPEAERHRAALLAKLENARASIDILIALTKNEPTAEEPFAVQARQLGTMLEDAGVSAMRFHFARQCVGAC